MVATDCFQHLAGSKWDLDKTQLLGRIILEIEDINWTDVKSGCQKEIQGNPEWKKSKFARVEREETFKKQIFIERLLCVRHCSTPLPKGNKKRGKKKEAANKF